MQSNVSVDVGPQDRKPREDVKKSHMLRGRMATSSSSASGVRAVENALAEGDSAGKSAHGSEAITHGGGGGRRTEKTYSLPG